MGPGRGAPQTIISVQIFWVKFSLSFIGRNTITYNRRSPWEELWLQMLKTQGEKAADAFKGQQLFLCCMSICPPSWTRCLHGGVQISTQNTTHTAFLPSPSRTPLMSLQGDGGFHSQHPPLLAAKNSSICLQGQVLVILQMLLIFHRSWQRRWHLHDRSEGIRRSGKACSVQAQRRI